MQRPLTDAEMSKIAKGESIDVLSNDLFRFSLQQRSLVATGENTPTRQLDLAEITKHKDSQGSTEHIAKNELDNPAYEGWSRGPARDPLAKPKPPKPKPIGRR